MTLPLHGLRIVAVEQYGAGPFGTQHLADLGAEVIRIENPLEGGDSGRTVGPHFFGPGDSHFHESFNRNKKSVTLNLKKIDGQKILHDLVATADATFNNLRGDLPYELGLTYDQLKAHNPKIVCGHLSAYGRTGPRTTWPGFDYLMQAETGYLSLTGEPDGPPARCGLSVIDYMTGVTAILGLLAAIIDARANGRGRDVDVSLFDVALHNLTYVGTWYLNEGVNTSREPRSAHPSMTPSQLYRTLDGWIFIMCNKEKFWALLVRELGKPEWENHPEFGSYKARLANREKLTRMLDGVLCKERTVSWLEKLAGKVPVAPVLNVADALENPFVHQQGRILEADHPDRDKVRTIACPIRCPGENDRIGIAPKLGQHTDEILTELNYTVDKIELLRKIGAI